MHWLGANRSTAKGIAKRYLQEDLRTIPHGRRNNTKKDDETRQCIQDIIKENPVFTLETVNETLRERLPEEVQIHFLTAEKMLDGMLYTRKI